jgi:GT2 family glycosyltransferase
MPDISIVIVTRDRKEKALTAVRSALAQEGDVEVIVIDDGSVDGTSEFLSRECPRAQIKRFETSEGYIVQRSRGGQLAKGRFLFSIDDDAEYTDPATVAQAAAGFDDPIVGAVALPFENVSPQGEVTRYMPVPPDDHTYVISSFVGTAYALRRDIFNRLGGFQDYLYHWGEETEYCLRLFDAGFLVRLVRTPHIRHYPGGAGKYTARTNRYIYRNKLITTWINAPTRYVLPLGAARTLEPLRAIVTGREKAMTVLGGIGMGYLGLFRALSRRRGLNAQRFRAWVDLHRRRIAPMDEVRAMIERTSGHPLPSSPVRAEARKQAVEAH